MTTLQSRSEALSVLEFQRVTEVPPEVASFANLCNPNTCEAYWRHGHDYTAHAGPQLHEGSSSVTRARVGAWCAHLLALDLSRAALRHELAAPIALGSTCGFRDPAGHAVYRAGVLFGRLKSIRSYKSARPHYPEPVYQSVVGPDAEQAGAEVTGVHAHRTTAATNALLRAADRPKVQQRLGHATQGTTRVYDRRGVWPKDINKLRVGY